MEAVTREEAEAYLNDADNYLEIPEFNLKPSAVDFEGFGYPIFRIGWPSLFSNGMHHAVGIVRGNAQGRFKSLQEVKEAHYRFVHLHVWDENAGAVVEERPWTEDEALAFMYFSFFDGMRDCWADFAGKRYKSAASNLSSALSYLLLFEGATTAGNYRSVESAVRARIGRAGATKRHAETNAVRQWLQNQWQRERAAYRDNKSAFARAYVPKLKIEHSVEVTEKTIREVWLRDPPSAGKQARFPAGR